MIEFIRHWFPDMIAGGVAGWFIVRSYYWKKEYKELEEKNALLRSANIELQEWFDNRATGALYYSHATYCYPRYYETVENLEIKNLNRFIRVITLAIKNHDIKIEQKDGKIRVWKDKEYPKVEAEYILEDKK